MTKSNMQKVRCGTLLLFALLLFAQHPASCSAVASQRPRLGRTSCSSPRWLGSSAAGRLRLRGGSAFEDESMEEGAELPTDGVSVDEAVRRVGQMQDSLELGARHQAQTKVLVTEMAADMLETHTLVKDKLAQLAAEGKDTARRELQDIAAALHEQMALVADSRVLGDGLADVFVTQLGKGAGLAKNATSPPSLLCAENGDAQAAAPITAPENPL